MNHEAREAVLRRWREWRAWTPPAPPPRARPGWPGFRPAPMDLVPPPTEWLADILGAYAEYDLLNATHFGGTCPPVKITVNPRLRATAGLVLTDQRIIELNGHRLRELPAVRIETVFHEMIHLWLYCQGLPAGHTEAFRAKMRERGHRSVRYGVEGDPKGPRHAYPGSDRRVLYRCPECGLEWERRRRYGRPAYCRVCYEAGRGRHRVALVAVISGRDPR